jgi:hypothetical protein
MIRLLMGSVLAVMLAQAASAQEIKQEIKSVYTTFDSTTCRHTKGKAEEDYGSWRCRGLNGIDVRLSAGDQRMHVSFGNAPTDEDLAATQSFPAFNNVYKGTVEWRGEALPGGKMRPFATILRWNVMTGKDEDAALGPVVSSGRVLVVTRLGPGGLCHVGYVDARTNADANELARKIADETARTFRCGTDEPRVLGKVGPGLAMPSKRG